MRIVLSARPGPAVDEMRRRGWTIVGIEPLDEEERLRLITEGLARHAKTLAAVVIEPFVLGPGGVLQQPKGYLERVIRAARKHDVPVIFDEVAVGMGRLGTLFAYEQLEDGLRPDVVCLAKGLTGGVLPLSAVIWEKPLPRGSDGRHIFPELA